MVITTDSEPRREEVRFFRHQLNHAAIVLDDLLYPMLGQLTPDTLALVLLRNIYPDEIPNPMHDPARHHPGETNHLTFS
jgi:hypothetical protein